MYIIIKIISNTYLDQNIKYIINYLYKFNLMRSRKQPNKVKSYTSRQNQNINHNGSNYNNNYDNSNNNTGGMSQHSSNSNSNNNKQNYNNMYQQQQQPQQYQLMMTNSMMQIQSKQTKQTQPKEKESLDVNETNNNNNNNALPNKKQIYHQQIPRGSYNNNNKNTQFQYKEHHHHPHYQQQQQQQNNSLSNSDSLNLSISSETTSQQAQSNQPLSRNSFMSERSSAPPPNYATFTPTYIINDPSFMPNYPLPINMYNPQSNIQMNQGKFPPFALGQNPQGNAGQVGVGQQKKPKTQVKGNQPQNIMLNMNYNNMMGIPFIGVNNAVNMKNNWNAQQQQNTNNKNMPFNQGVANTPSMQNIMNNVMLNNNNNNSTNSNTVLPQHQQIKTNNKHHFISFPRTVHSDKCIITTPDIFGQNYKQQFNKSNDNNSNSNSNTNSTVHTQHKQIFNTINIKLKLPTNNHTSSLPINIEFKLNLNDDIDKAINTHILTNNIDPKYTDAIYQKVLKAINLLTSIPETKLPKTSLKTLHDIHNLTTLLSTTNTPTDNDDINNTILDANTSFSYLIESTQYDKYISFLKPTISDYEPYHKLSSTI